MGISENRSRRRAVLGRNAWRRSTRIRIKLIANERGLSGAEIANALNCGTDAILAFAESIRSV
jgi:hypothetical protein